MIELIVASRCVGCGDCVAVCPMDVIAPTLAGPPRIARQDACQTCFLCELYCPADAIYVGPDCDAPVGADEAALVASGLLGQYRRDSGWGEWAEDARYANQHWRMEDIFSRARAAAAAHGGV